ncbi:uncharacterized protein [Musca autumnalis]|uniref:uncharacterized protein n=1 Tax=Musca autumnalis TaxID=221902 RepID=UPI003CE7B0DC
MSLQYLFKICTVIAWLPFAFGHSENPLDNLRLESFQAKSTSFVQINPERWKACSDYYVATSENITREFEVNNAVCAHTAAKARATIETEFFETQAELAQQVDETCGAIDHCKNAEGALLQLQCYVDKSYDGSKAIRSLSYDAIMNSAKLKEQLQEIDSQEGTCIAENRLKYESDSADVYDEFISCIYGQSTAPPPGHNGAHKWNINFVLVDLILLFYCYVLKVLYIV